MRPPRWQLFAPDVDYPIRGPVVRVVAGEAARTGGGQIPFVVRLLPNGALDLGLGDNGVARPVIPGAADATWFEDVAVHSNGAIVAAGASNTLGMIRVRLEGDPLPEVVLRDGFE